MLGVLSSVHIKCGSRVPSHKKKETGSFNIPAQDVFPRDLRCFAFSSISWDQVELGEYLGSLDGGHHPPQTDRCSPINTRKH